MTCRDLDTLDQRERCGRGLNPRPGLAHRSDEPNNAINANAMQAVPDDRTLIHCAANFRVTAFYSLYAMKHLDWTAAQASEKTTSKPHPNIPRFIENTS